MVALLGILTATASGQAAPLLLHSTMDSPQEIFQPDFAAAVYATLGEAVPGPDNVTFEPGHVGLAARFDGNGFQYDWPNDGPVRFHGDNFDFADPDDDGGRLDFWIKFNVDPHSTYANTWVARSNWGQRYINFEFSGSPADLMIDVYGDENNNWRTNYEKFRVLPRGWSVYENIRQGEWHQISVLWRRNGGPHHAELHIFIDGTQQGCSGCSDYNGVLPPDGSITDFFFSPALYDNYILFSIDEVYSFDSWDVSGESGNFADLQIPEGVTLKFPMSGDYPWWGNPVQTSQITYEFTVVNDQEQTCDCDLYVDEAFVKTVTATDMAHTEIPVASRLSNGPHSYQVKCDNDRLVSPLYSFTVDAPLSAPTESFSSFKLRFRDGN
jgi:hypothetical protein